MHRQIGLLLTIVFIVVGCTLNACKPVRKPVQKNPHIVLITIDTLRADHLSSYGYHRKTAPNIDRLARNGILFSNAISQSPWTLPSMASLHTSLYPSEHGAILNDTPIDKSVATIAESLKEAGYRTVGIVSHVFLSRKFGFDKGFDSFDQSNAKGHGGVTSKQLTRLAVTAFKDNKDKPVFLWVHYFDPHFSYVRHPEFGFASSYRGVLGKQIPYGRLIKGREKQLTPEDVRYVSDVYDEEIAYTDKWIGKLIDEITTIKKMHKTVFVLTADHGEYFKDRGRFGHGKDVFQELIHVPLVIGGDIQETLRGRVVKTRVEIKSIAKTILGLADVNQDNFKGVDLLSVARSPKEIPVYAEGNYAHGRDQRKKCIIDMNMKLIYLEDAKGYQLFDLSKDPKEKIDLWPSLKGSAMASRLQSKLRSFIKKKSAPKSVELSQDERKKLQGLGYMGND